MALFSFLLDASHRRGTSERQVLLAAAQEWSDAHRSGVWTDPITGTTVLCPNVVSPDWRTETGEGFRRLRRADYYVGSSSADNANASKWYEHNRGLNAADFFVVNRDTNDEMWTKQSWPANQGWYVSWFASNVGDESYIHLECGWGPPETGVSLRYWSDGYVEVWKAGSRIGTGQIKGSNSPGQTSGDNVGVLMVPWRMRELLVVSNTGSGFAWAFGDLPDDEQSPDILPAGQFWWLVPSGSAQVQAAPVAYAEAGTICGKTGVFREPPPAGATVETHVYQIGIGATARLVEDGDIETDLVPDGVKNSGRVRVDLAGDKSTTPYVLGGRAGVAPAFGMTLDESTEILCALKSWSLDVPDDPTGVRLSAQYKPEQVPDVTLARLRASNRALSVYLGAVSVIDMATEPPEFTMRSDAAGQLVNFEARDYTKSLEAYLFADEIPLDGMSVADAMRLVGSSAGEDPDGMVIDPDLEDLIISVADSYGEFGTVIKVGDNAQEWMDRLHETYCGLHYVGYRPTLSGYVWHCIPQTRDDASEFTLYSTLDEAGGDPTLVFRSYRERKLEPEANVIHVTGWDYSAKRPIVTSMEDTRSLSLTLPAAQRPDNWLGERRVYGLVDPALTSLAATERACWTMYQRLSWCRYLAEVESEMIILASGLPLWRGQCLTLFGMGVYRVIAFSSDPRIEKVGHIRRKTSYSLEFVRP